MKAAQTQSIHFSISKQYSSGFFASYNDINIRPASVTVLLGPSGGGKSTFIKCCTLAEKPSEGKIRLGHKTVFNSSTNSLDTSFLWRELSVVFQKFFLWPHLSAIDNVMLPLIAWGKSTDHVATIMHRLDITALACQPVYELSAGQQQRFAIARALATSPSFLFLDEATSALDNEQTGFLVDFLIDISKQGVGVIIVTHHLGVAETLLREVSNSEFLFIAEGQVQEKGNFSNFTAPSTKRLVNFLRRRL